MLPAQVFACSYSYVFTLTIPNSVLTYWAFPQDVAEFGNAFAVYPPSALRTTAIILMIGHQMVAFLLFIMPVRSPRPAGSRCPGLETAPRPAAVHGMHLPVCAAGEVLGGCISTV